MQTTKIADQIDAKERLLVEGRGKIMPSAEAKAKTIGEYDKKLAIVLIKLKNGESLSLEGNTIEKPPATLAEKIAKGICWEERMNMELATAMYKGNISKLESVQAELNGLQSKNKWLESN